MKKLKKLFSIATVLVNLHAMSTPYTSQVGQDRYLNENYFKNKKGGIFVDIGAHDGKTYSNTYFFEKELNWTGISFEPLPKVFEKLKSTRNCICINACVSNSEKTEQFIEVEGYPEMLSGMVSTYDPRHLSRLKQEIAIHGGKYKVISVPSVTLNKILEKNNLNKIDYLSLDTEGSELLILQSIDFDTVKIYAISVENNYNNPKIRQLLESKGFKYITALGPDEIYINTSW